MRSRARRFGAIGHSGAYRTLISWLGDSRLSEIILLDALYGDRSVKQFGSWIAGGARRHLIVVAAATIGRTEELVHGFGHQVVREGVPATDSSFSAGERRARLLYLRSQYGHQAMVSEGRVIPPTLGLTQLSPIEARTRAE